MRERVARHVSGRQAQRRMMKCIDRACGSRVVVACGSRVVVACGSRLGAREPLGGLWLLLAGSFQRKGNLEHPPRTSSALTERFDAGTCSACPPAAMSPATGRVQL
eukprot:316695-Chlamydomonas_euryale.AAC.1